jgi:hypothetical protein
LKKVIYIDNKYDIIYNNNWGYYLWNNDKFMTCLESEINYNVKIRLFDVLFIENPLLKFKYYHFYYK